MIIKEFPINGRKRRFHCYEHCPASAGIELYTVVNDALDKLNKLLDDTYNAYKQVYPDVTRPTLYVYLREDNLKDINAFTEGINIYLSAGAIFGLRSYMDQRLDTKTIDGEDLFPEGFETKSVLKIYDYILELIVAHELIHIWHRHGAWEWATVDVGGIKQLNLENKVFSELVCFEEDKDNSCDNLGFEHLQLNNGRIVCKSKKDVLFIEQVLELDADSCGMCIVVNNLNKEISELVKKYVEGAESEEDRKLKTHSIMNYHRYMINMIVAAAGLMCGYFDSRRMGTNFDRVNQLLLSNHPIQAIRFYNMKLTLAGVLSEFFKDDEIVDALLSHADTFTADIFMHKDNEMDIRNCFWAPVHTKEVQEFMTWLNRGWNLIYDSLQQYAWIKLPDKYEEEDFVVRDEDVWFEV